MPRRPWRCARHVERHPDDVRSRLRFAAAADRRWASAPPRAARSGPSRPPAPRTRIGREALRRLAELDEAEGALVAAAERWERILADDIDDPQARAPAGAAAPHAARAADIDPSQTLVVARGRRGARATACCASSGAARRPTVYLARDGGLGLDVALKVLHPQLAGAAARTRCRRFFAEARVAASIRHPGVVAIYDVDEEARALAMELVAGGTLRAAAARHPGGLPAAELRATARDAAGRAGPRPRARHRARRPQAVEPAAARARARSCSPTSAPPS